MDYSWFFTSWSSILVVFVSSLIVFGALIVFTRFAGLRSFSKISGYDFGITVAFGAIIASSILAKNPSVLRAVAALASLFIIQRLISYLRRNSHFMHRLFDNQPLLLMRGSEIIEANLKEANISHNDLRAKLRESNIKQLHQVEAVIMETTGDLSVIYDDGLEYELDEELLQGVKQ